MPAKKTNVSKKISKAARPSLAVEKRKLKGHQLKKVRRQGILPANIYGRGIKSLMVQAELKKVEKFFGQYGETNVVDLIVKGEKKPRPVLMKNPQNDPVEGNLLHLDFYQVNLAEKVKAEIPIVIYGKAPAVERGEGVLVQAISEMEVEALPTDLPEEIGVDVSKLEKVGDDIVVKDLDIDRKKIEPQVEESQVVAKIEPVAKEEEPEVKSEEEGEEAAAAEEGKPAEGDEKKPAAGADSPAAEKQKP